MGPLTGVPRALERRQRGPDRPLLAAEVARLRGLRLFSKQFRKGYSAKLAPTVSSEVVALVSQLCYLVCERSGGERVREGGHEVCDE
jgi:hypothetical protein